MFEERKKRMVEEFEAKIAALEADLARKRITPEMMDLGYSVQKLADELSKSGIRLHEVVVDRFPMWSIEKPDPNPGEHLCVMTVVGTVNVKRRALDAVSPNLDGV